MNQKSKLYDLHCHSVCSDGKKTPLELIDIAKERGLSGISITDHDSVNAYTDELIDYANSQSIELITGIELSTVYQGGNGYSQPVHILGYNIDHRSQQILDICADHKKRRKERFNKIIHKLMVSGIEIDDIACDYRNKEVLGRPHIAELLVKKKYAKNVQEAFNKFIGDHAPFYVSSKVPTIEETINAIKHSGGKAVLAHPILIKGKKILRRLLENYKFDGMECYYGNFPIDRIEYLLKICEEKKLLITGGSDYHGLDKNFIRLGSSFVTEERVEELFRIS